MVHHYLEEEESAPCPLEHSKDYCSTHKRDDLPCFIPPAEIPHLNALLLHTPGFIAELITSGALDADMTSGSLSEQWRQWPDRELAGDRWHVLPLKVFGEWTPLADRFPTTKHVLSAYPGLSTASFSRLRPGTAMKPHAGLPVTSKNTLRAHVGLFVPGKAAMHVGDEEQNCSVGAAIVFDEMQTHYAVNDADGDRITLLLDVPRPTSYPFKPHPPGHFSTLADVDGHPVINEDAMIKQFAAQLIH